MERPYKRTNPSGSVKWLAPVTDPNTGKRTRVGTFGTKKEAEQAQLSYYRSVGVGIQEMTVEDYFEHWRAEHPRPSKKTNDTNHYRVGHYCVPHIGNMACHEVRRKHVLSLRNELMKSGLSAVSIRDTLGSLSAMFTDAVEDEAAELNPVFKIKVPSNDPRITAKPPRKKIILTYGQMLDLANCAPVEYRAAVLFSGATGARPSEVLPRRYDDLDREQGLVRIDTTAERGSVLAGTKTDHGDAEPGRWSILTPELEAFIDAAPRSLTGFLCPTPRGKVWWLDNFRHRVFQPAAIKAGFGKLVEDRYVGLAPYDLRHSFISLMQEAGVPVADLAKRTGHQRISTLMDVYTHALGRSDDRMREVLSA